MAEPSWQLPGELGSRIAQVEARLREFSDAAQLTNDCLNLLAQARAEIVASRFPEAHALVARAECLLWRTDKSAHTLRKWGPSIGIYEVALLFGLLLLALRGERWMGWLFGERPAAWLPIAPYCLWGGLGGVAAALFGFYRHSARRDFDRGYVAYYFLKPIMGLVLGPLVYLFARAGLMAIQSQGRAVERAELLYLGAFVLGFGERFSLRLIDRVAAAIFGPSEAAQAPQPEAAGRTLTTRVAPAEEALPATGSIRVQVVGPEPDDLHDVSAAVMREDQPLQVKGPPPDEGATFVFDRVPPGACQVVVSKPGWKQVTRATAEASASGQASQVLVQLEPESKDTGGEGDAGDQA